MRDRLGEEFSGTVTAAVAFGLFVTLDELFVEGLVHVTELGGEYFRFDEVRQELRGERSGMRYGVGSRVRVQVSRVDLDARRIDFRLVREGSVERSVSRARVDRARADEAAASAVEALAATQAEDLSVKAAVRRQRKGVAKERVAAASRKRPATGKARKSSKSVRSVRSR
jgi:ribonuclease R